MTALRDKIAEFLVKHGSTSKLEKELADEEEECSCPDEPRYDPNDLD